MIKTSELIEKLAFASEESCKCEDENFNRVICDVFCEKSATDCISLIEMVKVIRAITDYSRFTSIRTICKVLQDLGITENDIDVFNNDEFRNVLVNCFGQTESHLN